jgi:Skp family chaperone for outer membrane proteins
MAVGVINMIKLLDESKRGLALIQQLQGAAEKWQAKARVIEKKPVNVRENLQKTSSTPNVEPEVLFRMQREQQMYELELKQLEERSRADLESSREHFRAQVLMELSKHIEKVAKEKGLKLVLTVPSNEVAYFAPTLDITDELMRRFDTTPAAGR